MNTKTQTSSGDEEILWIPDHDTASPLWNLRFAIIRWLAGPAVVVLNAKLTTIDGDDIVRLNGDKNTHAFLSNNEFGPFHASLGLQIEKRI